MLEEHTWLAQSVECVTLDLRVMGSNPMWEVEILKKKILKKKKKGRTVGPSALAILSSLETSSSPVALDANLW